MKNNVPSNWSIKNISEIANTSSGGTPSRSNIQFYTNGIYPWVKTGELGNKYLYDAEEYITEDAINNSSAKLIEKNSVIMAMYGATIGKMSINKVEVTTNQACCSISCNKNIYNYEFLYYILSLQKENIIKLGAGGAQPNISQEIIKRYKILCPPLEEQDKIAEILSTWDLAIEKQEQLIEKKKEFKKGLMQMLLSGEVRFKEFNDKWKIKEIGNYIEEYKEKSTISNQYPVLTSSRNGIVLQKDYFKDNQVTTNDNIGYNIIPKGYITFRTRSDDGTFVFNQNKIIDMGIVSYFYPVFKFNEEINTYFAITWLNSCIDKQIRREIVGTSQLVLSLNKLKKFKINLPSIKEQNKIAEVLISVDEEIELLEKELEAIKLQKKGLMQRLLTGEVRVKV